MLCAPTSKYLIDKTIPFLTSKRTTDGTERLASIARNGNSVGGTLWEAWGGIGIKWESVAQRLDRRALEEREDLSWDFDSARSLKT